MDEDDATSNEDAVASALFDDRSADSSMDQFGEDDVGLAGCDVGDDEVFARTMEEMLNLAQQNLDTDNICDMLGIQEIIKRVRKPKKVLMWTEDDGRQRPILPRQSYWYNIYIAHPDIHDASFQNSFGSAYVFRMKSSKSLIKILKVQI